MTSGERTRRQPRPAQASGRGPIDEPDMEAGAELGAESAALVSAKMSDADAERVLTTVRQRLLARGDESALLASLPEAPEKKLDAIQTLLLELSTISAQITPEQHKADPAVFADAVAAVDQRIKQIETLLVTFVTAAQTEYPKITVWQKFILALATVIHGTGRETNLLLALSRAEAKREQLLAAEPKLRDLLEAHRAQIEQVKQELQKERERPIRIRQMELLAGHERYQQLTVIRRRLAHDSTLSIDLSKLMSIHTRIAGIDAELAQLKQTAFDRAEQEISQRGAGRE